MTVLLSLLLAQVVTPTPSTAEVVAARWPVQATWRDGAAERTVHLDESLVAERGPQEATASTLRAQGAMVSLTRGRMRLWRVERAAQALESDPRLLPVYRDEGGPKLRVPLGAVLVVPARGLTPQQLKAQLPRTGTVENGIVRVVCEPSEALALAKSLSALPGVGWAQPDWWLGATKR